MVPATGGSRAKARTNDRGITGGATTAEYRGGRTMVTAALQHDGDRFVLGAPLGRGSTAVVYRARSTTRGELAIKLLHEHVSRSALARRRLANEAKIVAAVPSPHAPNLIACGVDGSQPFLAMERFESRTLRDELKRVGAMGPDEARTFLVSACEAVEAIHAAGFAHLDLKPTHLFVGSPDVRLVDFGSACANGEPPSATGSGTPAYMSPERLEARLESPARADVWALGVVAFECLAGCRPFSGASRSQLVAQVLRGRIPRVGEVVPRLAGSGLEQAIVRALSRDPEQRYDTCAAFGRALADEG